MYEIRHDEPLTGLEQLQLVAERLLRHAGAKPGEGGIDFLRRIDGKQPDRPRFAVIEGGKAEPHSTS